jgi:hypothetical protein
MLGVRWSHALYFIVVLLFIGSHEQYAKSLIPLRTSMVALFQPYSFSCLFHYILIGYEQSNAPPSTLITVHSSQWWAEFNLAHFTNFARSCNEMQIFECWHIHRWQGLPGSSSSSSAIWTAVICSTSKITAVCLIQWWWSLCTGECSVRYPIFNPTEGFRRDISCEFGGPSKESEKFLAINHRSTLMYRRNLIWRRRSKSSLRFCSELNWIHF